MQTDYASKFSIVKDTKMGEGTTVGGHCNIYGGDIGRDSKIGPYTYMEPNTRVGDRVNIRPGCHIGEGVVIEDDVFMGPGVYTTNDLYPSKLKVAPLPTRICEGAVIGGGAVLLPVRIGRRAFVAAGSVVTRDVPDFAVVAGSPAKQIGSVTDESFVAKQKMRDAGLDPRKRA